MSQHRPYKNTEVFYDSDNSICKFFHNDNRNFCKSQNKRMNGYSLIAIQLFGEFVNGI